MLAARPSAASDRSLRQRLGNGETMRITPISTPTRTQVPNYIGPTGIISLAAYFPELGARVSVVDAAALLEPRSESVARV